MSDYKRNPRGARRARKSTGRKAIVVLSLMLVLVLAAVGGTFAWLTDSTDTVTNTFKATDIEVTLTETEGVENGKWEVQLIPGKEYGKNPVVTVTNKTDIDVYLFVQRSDTVSQYLNYTDLLDSAHGWTRLNMTDDVWYRIVHVSDQTKSWNLIGDNNKVTVKNSIVKHGTSPVPAGCIEMPASTADLHLTYTAYAVQYEGFESKPADAWAAIQANGVPTT